MKPRNKKILSISLVSLFIISAILLFLNMAPLIGKKYIKINDSIVYIEVADTNEKRSKGLGYRDSLPQDNGMLFTFDEARPWPFWMQGMRFPLDYIWIREEKVVDLSKNVPTQTEQNPVYVTPKENITSVLEVNAGWIDKNNIKIGDKVEIHD
jgi:uncharacterized membrane protein (UPF0127 family)